MCDYLSNRKNPSRVHSVVSVSKYSQFFFSVWDMLRTLVDNKERQTVFMVVITYLVSSGCDYFSSVSLLGISKSMI